MKRVTQMRLQLPEGFREAVEVKNNPYGNPEKRNIRIYGAIENINALKGIPLQDRFDAIEIFCDYTAEIVFGSDICELCQIDPALVVNETSLDYIEAKVLSTHRRAENAVKQAMRGKGSPRKPKETAKLQEKAYQITRLMAIFKDVKDVRERLRNYYEDRNDKGVIGHTVDVFSPNVVFRDAVLDCEMFELYRRKEITRLVSHVVVSFKHTAEQKDRITLLCRRIGAQFVKEFAPDTGHWIGITREYTPTETHSAIRLHLFISTHNKDGSVIVWKPHNVIAMSKFAPCPEVRLGHGKGITSNIPGDLPYPKAAQLKIRDVAVQDAENNIESEGRLTRKIQTLMKPEERISPGYEQYFGPTES